MARPRRLLGMSNIEAIGALLYTATCSCSSGGHHPAGRDDRRDRADPPPPPRGAVRTRTSRKQIARAAGR
jgi:hypothetical protein